MKREAFRSETYPVVREGSILYFIEQKSKKQYKRPMQIMR